MDPLQPEEVAGRTFGRRLFLGLVLGGLGLAAAGGRIADSLTRAASRIGGDGFRIYTVAPMPDFDRSTFRLSVEGLVESPLTLSIDDINSLGQETLVYDFRCVTGWVVRDSRWSGPALRTILDKARLRPEASHIVFKSFDGAYVEILTREQALDEGVVIAHSLFDEPLTKEHGAPIRSIVPAMYGYKGTKWLGTIVATDKPLTGYWEQRGYDTDAYVGRSNGFRS